MAKKPNLLNNLLRRLRELKYPSDSITTVAEKLENIPVSYLTKIENGDLEKPNDENFKKLLKAYGSPKEWGETLTAIWKMATDGDLSSDESPTILPVSTCLVPMAACMLPTAVTRQQIFGPSFAFSPTAVATGRNSNVNQCWVAYESLLNYLIANPRSGKDVTNFLMMPSFTIYDASKHPFLSRVPSRTVHVEGVLLALGTHDNKWAVTANEDTLKAWETEFKTVTGEVNYNAIHTLNLMIAKLSRVRAIPTTPSTSEAGSSARAST